MIRRAILLILINGMALYVSTQVLPGEFVVTGGLTGILVSGLIFGLLNSIVKPILKVVTLPVVFLSGGLFIIVINAIILWLAKYALQILEIQGITIQITGGWNIWLYTILIVSAVNIIMNWLTKN